MIDIILGTGYVEFNSGRDRRPYGTKKYAFHEVGGKLFLDGPTGRQEILGDMFTPKLTDQWIGETDGYRSMSTVTKLGQVFKAIKGGKLTSAFFKVVEYGTVVGNAKAELYAAGGNPETGLVTATGSVLATSASTAVSSLPTEDWFEFTFPVAQQYVLTEGTWYVIVVDQPNGDATNRIALGNDLSSVGCKGNSVNYSGTWGANASYDIIFRTYVRDYANVTYAGGGGPTDPTTMSELMDILVQYY